MLFRLRKYINGKYGYVDTTHLPPKLIIHLHHPEAPFAGFEVTTREEAQTLSAHLTDFMYAFDDHESGAS